MSNYEKIDIEYDYKAQKLFPLDLFHLQLNL